MEATRARSVATDIEESPTSALFDAWMRSSKEEAWALTYVWGVENLQNLLFKVAARYPIEGRSVEDQAQEALISVSRSALARRDGAIEDGEALVRYLRAGAARHIRFRWVDHHRARNNPKVLVKLRAKAEAMRELLTIAEIRARMAADLDAGLEGWTTPAREQARYEAAEAILEVDAALWVEKGERSDVHERLVELAAELVEVYDLSPDSHDAWELLEARTAHPYLRWRLGLDAPGQRNQYDQVRRQVRRKLAKHPERDALLAAVVAIGRHGLVILPRKSPGS